MSSSEIQKLSDFVRLKRVISDAVALYEKQKGPVLSIVQKTEDAQVKIDGMTLEEGLSVSYEYPSAVLRQEEKLRQLKKLMQNPLDGRALRIEKPVLICRDTK